MAEMMTWTPERVDAVLGWREAGESFAAIAARFGCSRSAIVGLVGRVRKKTPGAAGAAKVARGLAVVPAPRFIAPAANKPRAAIVPVTPERRRPFQPKAVLVAPEPRREAPFVAPAGAATTLFDLPATGRCRWPYDDSDGVGRLACAAATGSTDLSVVYCPAHRALAYQPRVTKAASAKGR